MKKSTRQQQLLVLLVLVYQEYQEYWEYQAAARTCGLDVRQRRNWTQYEGISRDPGTSRASRDFPPGDLLRALLGTFSGPSRDLLGTF